VIKSLVPLVEKSLAVVGGGFKALVGGLGPDEWLGLLVPLVDPRTDVGLEFGDGGGLTGEARGS
jgi:hypothetical protein